MTETSWTHKKSILWGHRRIFYKKFHTENYYLVVGINANDSDNIRQDLSVFIIFKNQGLHNAMQHLTGEDRPSTITWSRQVIDHIFVSHNLLPHIVWAGQLRRNITLCPNIQQLYSSKCRHSTVLQNHMYPKSPGKLSTIGIAGTERYLEELRVQSVQNNIQNRVKHCSKYRMSNGLPRIQYSTTTLTATWLQSCCPRKRYVRKHSNYEWNPDLAAAATELAYW